MAQYRARPVIRALRLVLMMVASAPGAALSQTSLGSSDAATVTPGRRYAAGSLHRWLFGPHYRELWRTRITLPVLDLERFAGGLTPDELGGGQQTKSLHFKSGDGREFTFRSLDKDPTPALPEAVRGTLVDRLAQDATSAMHPGGSLAASALVEAAGLLHARPRLAVMPDHPRLGEHRAMFGGMVGLFELKTGDGFAGAGEVADSEDLFEKLRESPSHRVDPREFLTARLLDHLMGDWDRHAGQWRWAAFETERGTRWRPIPRDRDQAFSRYDGLTFAILRKAHPKLVVFGPKYPGLYGLTTNGRLLDRALLAPLARPVYDSVAVALQETISDSVIAVAMARMPAPYQGRWTEWMAEALRRRRDGLRAQADRYYRMVAEDVDVWATDADEAAEARWDSDGALLLTLREAGDSAPYFERRFLPDETSEVRLHLLGGDDRVAVGEGGGGVQLLVVRGEGSDSVMLPDGRTNVTVYEPAPRPQASDSSELTEPEVRDWGKSFTVGPRAGYDADLGVLLGAGVGGTDYAFRKEPYGSRWRLDVGYATAAGGFRADLGAELRQVDPRTWYTLLARASEIEVVRFNGLGNETPDAGEAGEVDPWQLTLAPAIEHRPRPWLHLRGGPMLRHTEDASGRLGLAGVVGVKDSLRRVELAAGVYPVSWDGGRTFGDLSVRGMALLPLAFPGGPTLAVRAGGKRVWGRFPFDEAAFLGGQETLRGFDYQRFAGDASAFGGVELRVPVARILRRLVPTEVGVFGLGDAGRVWAEGTASDRVHAAAGAGVWLAFIEPANTVSLAWASSREGDRWYLRWGLPY